MGESGLRLPGGKSLGSRIFAIAATVVKLLNLQQGVGLNVHHLQVVTWRVEA